MNISTATPAEIDAERRMTLTRRAVLLGTLAVAASPVLPAHAQTTPTVQGILDRWNARMGAEYGVRLTAPPTHERHGYTALTDPFYAQHRVEAITPLLARYPAHVIRRSRLEEIQFVVGGRAMGGGRLIRLPYVTPYVLHHEMQHVLDSSFAGLGTGSTPHPRWRNSPGFLYGQPWYDNEGFVSNYAKKAYREDLADVAASLWTRPQALEEQASDDPLLAAKAEVLDRWYRQIGATVPRPGRRRFGRMVW